MPSIKELDNFFHGIAVGTLEAHGWKAHGDDAAKSHKWSNFKESMRVQYGRRLQLVRLQLPEHSLQHHILCASTCQETLDKMTGFGKHDAKLFRKPLHYSQTHAMSR
jgi:hypothetical protein